MDSRLRDAERSWRANPSDLLLLEQAIEEFGRARARVPVDLLSAHPRWGRVSGFVAKWFGRPIRREDGLEPEQLGAIESRVGRLPAAVREWNELVGVLFSSRDHSHIHMSSPPEVDPQDPRVAWVAWCTDNAFEWGVRTGTEEADPVTVARHDGEVVETKVRVSDLALQVALANRLMGPASRTGTTRRRDRPPWPELPLPPMHWGSGERMYFFGDTQTAVGIFLGGEYGGTAHLAAVTSDALASAERRFQRCTWID